VTAGATGAKVVHAAGAVLRREAPDGGWEVLVVHRPGYDDWTFPKGKRDPGESDEDCARREVEEETGLRCELGPELPGTGYDDHKGRPKVVRYWAATAVGGTFAPNAEVDVIAWLGPDEARARLSYARDLTVLEAALTA
jgi:8-oxo-dGTP diphosphatase